MIAGSRWVRGSHNYSLNYNVAPTSYLAVVRNLNYNSHIQEQYDNIEQLEVDDSALTHDDKELTFMKWGWNSYYFIINARVEKIQEKPTFRPFLSSNRCVVIVSGYYNWNAIKQPFVFKPSNTDHFLLAGLYNDKEEVLFMTRQATKELEQVHIRMPVFLQEDEVDKWLDSHTPFMSIIDSLILDEKKYVWTNLEFY